jgi:hypothetical protein
MTPVAEECFSASLRERLAPALGALGRRAVAWDPENPDELRRWLVVTWQAIRASASLLESATQELERGPQSSFTDLLFDYYTLLGVERSSRDGQMVARLSAVGVTLDVVRLELPNRHIAALVGSQYYLVRHYHPALLLGYIAFCQADPPGPQPTGTAASPMGWGSLLMAERDPGQLESLRLVLDEVPLDPSSLRPAIVVNALRCAASYGAAIDTITREKRAHCPT